jgi:hypothetical protein
MKKLEPMKRKPKKSLEDQIKESIREHRRFAQTAYDDHNECETHDARLITKNEKA